MDKTLSSSFESFYNRIKEILTTARNRVYRAANFEMVQAYWQIGNAIVEEEQKGKARAEYGKRILIALASRLTTDYGKGFDESNLRNMRKFYLTYTKRDALRPELTWTHYRILMHVEKEKAREFYLQEAIEGNWSTRQLERQVNSLYFERILIIHKEGRILVKKEAEDKKEEM
jgi:predicted nuclease of restriction endonuclease-like (RecB) superfamily